MMPEVIKFTVFCDPQPQGSSRAFVVPGKDGGKPRAVVTSANKNLRPYRQELTRAAMVEISRLRLDTFEPPASKHVPVMLKLDFYIPRPPSAPKKRTFPSVTPDLDKFVRSTCDSLTKVLWNDDAQICDLHARKFYGSPARVEVSMRIAETEGNGIPADSLFSKQEREPVEEQAHGD